MRTGVLFDLDGTLWDSTEAIAPAWDRVLAPLGRHITAADMAGVMGMTDKGIAAKLLPGLPAAEAVAAVRAASREEVADIRRTGGRLYPAVEETLRKLAAAGYRLFIVSNCLDGYVDAFLDAHGLRSLFADAAWLGNPADAKAANIRALADRWALDRAVYVGDTATDGEAARGAGLPFLHARYGFGGETTCDGSLTEFAALPDALARLWKE